MALSANEIERYSRHIVLKGLGGSGQQMLKKSSVLIIGAGGLGSPIIAYLAAAGVGTIGIIDDDDISLSNLSRQIIHKTKDLEMAKTTSAKNFALELNDKINIELHQVRVDKNNARELIANYDIVVDGCDNFQTRQIVANEAQKAKKPLVGGGVSMFDGQLSVFAPFLLNKQGQANPSFNDLYPNISNEDNLPTCEQTGMLGAITGVIGTLMAMETIKLITKIGEPLIGRLLLYDGRSAKFSEISYKAKKS